MTTESPVGSSHGRENTKRRSRTESAKAGDGAVMAEPFFEPTARWIYNLLMGGVDGNDQHRSWFNMRLKRAKRWWIALWVGSLDIAVVNAMIHYRHWQTRLWKEKSPISNKDFRLLVVQGIMEKYGGVDEFDRLREAKRATQRERQSRGSSHRSVTSASSSVSSTSSQWSGFDYSSPPPIMDSLDDVPERHYLEKTSATRNAGSKDDPRLVPAAHTCVVCASRRPLQDISKKEQVRDYKAAQQKIITSWVCSHPRCKSDSILTYVHVECNAEHERMCARIRAGSRQGKRKVGAEYE